MTILIIIFAITIIIFFTRVIYKDDIKHKRSYNMEEANVKIVDYLVAKTNDGLLINITSCEIIGSMGDIVTKVKINDNDDYIFNMPTSDYYQLSDDWYK